MDDNKEDLGSFKHPILKDASNDLHHQRLSTKEIVAQAFSLVFALQKGEGLKRAADLLETNPKSVILAGLLSMVIFFTLCFTISQIILKFVA